MGSVRPFFAPKHHVDSDDAWCPDVTIPTCSPAAFWCSYSVLWSFWWLCFGENPPLRGLEVSLHTRVPPLRRETIKNFEIKSPSAAQPRPCWIHMICQRQNLVFGLSEAGNSPLSLLSRYSAAWSRVAILIAGIGRTEERRSGVRARPLLTGKACLVAGRAAAQLPQAVTAAAAAGSTGPSAAPSNGGESPAIWCLPKPRNYFSKPKNGFRSWIKTAGDTETDTKRAKQLGQSI